MKGLVQAMPIALLLMCVNGAAALPLKALPTATGAGASPSRAALVGRESPLERSINFGRSFRQRMSFGPRPVVLFAASGEGEEKDGDGNSFKQPQRGDGAEGQDQNENEPSSTLKEEKSPLYLFFDALEMTFSYTFQFVGNAIFVGIFLNLIGYGYYFDSKKGLQIDTLANVRELVQFQDAAKQMQASRQEVEVQPISSLPK